VTRNVTIKIIKIIIKEILRVCILLSAALAGLKTDWQPTKITLTS